MTANYENERLLEKPLPSSADSERIILGASLLDNSVFPQAVELLKPEDFYSPSLRRIYRAMLDLFERSEAIEPIMIGEELKKVSQLENTGGVAAIANLTYGLPHFSDIGKYCHVVRNLAQVRRVIAACSEIANTALAEEDEPETILNFAQSKMNEVCTREDKKGFEFIGKIADRRFTEVETMCQNGVQFTGLRTGLRDLDQMTGGLQKTDFIVVAGRPGMGKSALAGNIAEGVTEINPAAVVAVFSLEMSKEQYTDRIICSIAKVDYQRYRNGFLIRDERQRIFDATIALAERKIVIDDTSSISPIEARSKLMRLQAEQKRLDLIVIDYMQRMKGSKRTESRQQEVSSIARELKSLAKDFETPVIALSSLSRACEARNPPKPRMSDLRESGDIESEADLVAFIYRDEYYNQSDSNAGVAELLIEKHRHGPTGVVKVAFMKEYAKFANYYE